MANPYGITEVNIPAMLGMHQQMKRRRIEDLYRAKEYERADRADQREQATLDAYARVFGGGGASAQPAASAPSEAPQAEGDATSILPAAPQTAPASPIFQPDPNALRALMATGPEGAKAAQAISQMGAEQLKSAQEAATRALEIKGRVIGGVRALPPENRNAAYQVERANLQRMGVDTTNLPEQWDENVADQMIQQSMKAAEALGLHLEAQRFGETVRHNRATEANSAASTGIAAGNLALSRQREARVTKWGPQSIIVGTAGAPRTDTSDLEY